MVDEQSAAVCCMCGDVGFPEKLFACKRCRFRYQHWYCRNLYGDSSSSSSEVCDWCQSEHKLTTTKPTPLVVATSPRHARRHATSSSSTSTSASPSAAAAASSASGRSPAGVPSPRQGTRRYKLLKDVMC